MRSYLRAFVFYVFSLPSFASTIIDQSFTFATDTGARINSCCAFIGQTYTAGLSGTLAGVSVDVLEYPPYNFPLGVQIRTASGGFPTTVILGEATATAFSLSDLISFPQTIPQVAGVQYAIVVHFVGAPPPEPNGFGNWHGSGAILYNPYPGGMSVFSFDGGNSWPLFFDGFDSHFVTYVNVIPEPASLFLFGTGALAMLTSRRSRRVTPQAPGRG